MVDPASIPVERHKRRAKTDRLDAIKLVINLRAWLRGERDRMHVVHVPSPQDEAPRDRAVALSEGRGNPGRSAVEIGISKLPKGLARQEVTVG